MQALFIKSHDQKKKKKKKIYIYIYIMSLNSIRILPRHMFFN